MANAVIFSGIEPGHQLILRGGEYTLSGAYKLLSPVSGGPGNLTTISNFPGETAVIRHEINQQGSYTQWISEDYGLLREGNDPNRINTEGPSLPTEAQGWVLDDYDNSGRASGCNLINLRVKDNIGSGIFWFGAQTGLLYGNIICNNGWVGSDREHGPGHYMYNQSYDHHKTIKNTVVLNSFRPGSQIGDGGGSYPARNFTFEDFTSNARFFAGGPSTDTLIARRLWLSSQWEVLQLGLYATDTCGTALIEDSVIDAPLQFRINHFQEITFRRCKFTASTHVVDYEPEGGTTLVMDDCEVITSGQHINFVPNEYAPRFATLSVLDLDEGGTVAVDISARAVSGTVRVHNPMLWSEYQDLTVTNGMITLPMTGWTTPPPLGYAETWAAVFSARFGVFLLEVLA